MQENNIIDEIQGTLEGSVIKQRFQIARLIDCGSFGKVYKCVDLLQKNKPLVIKITEDYRQFGQEINAMKKVFSKQSSRKTNFSTPEVVDYGMILFTANKDKEEELLSYMVMPRYGQNLESYFERQNCNISNSSIHEMAKATLKMLEQVHEAGFIFNDLKLDNIMAGFKDRLPRNGSSGNVFADGTLHLIDFGFATRYIDKDTGLHIKQEEVETFRGNMIFGSLNQLSF